MANNTVYPYGTNGELPSSIGLVNDLVTGGSDKALAAEQGLVLNNKVLELQEHIKYYDIESEINLSSLPAKNGFIANDTQWITPVSGHPRTHVSIPVVSGEWYQIETTNTKGMLAFLRDDQIPTSNLETINAVGNSVLIDEYKVTNFQIPEGCTYLAINKTRTNENDWLPSKLYKTSQPDYIGDAIPNLQKSVLHIDNPPFFSKNADWDVVKTDFVRGTLVCLELLSGVVPENSYVRWLGGRESVSGQFLFQAYDADGNLISAVANVIPTDGTLTTLYSSGKCVFKLTVDGSKMRVNAGSSFYDWGTALILDDSYLKVEGTPKNILCFGDSITQFADTEQNIPYTEYLAKLSGCNVINAGIGGTRLSRRANPTAPVTTEEMAWAGVDISNLVSAWVNNDWTVVDSAVTYLYNQNHNHDYRDIVSNLKTIDINSIDIITIFGGTNDFTAGASLGTIGSTDINNVAGALEVMFNLILTAKPSIEIYVFTPIVRYISNNRTDAYWSDNYVSNGKKLPDVASFIEDTCKYYHVNCNNWYWSLGWNRFNFSEYFNNNDGTHPYKGMDFIGEKMFKYLNERTMLCKK